MLIADLFGGGEQVDRSSLTVADGVQLGVHAAHSSSDLTTTPPLFGGHAGGRLMGLAVCRVYHHGLLFAVCSSASPATIRPKMPFPLQRFLRLQSVSWGPYAAFGSASKRWRLIPYRRASASHCG